MDKMRTAKTFKSGFITFSSRYQASKLMESLTEAKTLYMTIRDLPIVPQYAAPLEEELVKRSIFGTAAIEGNPLSEEKVGKIVEKPIDVSRQLEQFEQEIKNLQEAYNEFVVSCPQSGTNMLLQEDQIKRVHRIITDKVKYENNLPGKYRNEKVKVGDKDHGGIYTPPKILADIESLMKIFIDWMNSEGVLSLEPIIRAALAHYYLGLIHPFRDGNGRTARIVEAHLLTCSGYKYVPVMLSNFYYKNIDQYFLAFSVTEKNKNNDMTYFLEFVTRGLVESLREIKDRIIHIIRGLALKDYYSSLRYSSEINQRQYDILFLMLTQSKPLSFKELFDNPPFSIIFRSVVERTAKRDLQKLCELQVLRCEKDKYFMNINILDSFGSVLTVKAKK